MKLFLILPLAILLQSGRMDSVHTPEPFPLTVFFTPSAPAYEAGIEIDAPWPKIEVYELAVFDDEVVRLLSAPTGPGPLQLRLIDIFGDHLHEYMNIGVSIKTNYGQAYLDGIRVRLE